MEDEREKRTMGCTITRLEDMVGARARLCRAGEKSERESGGRRRERKSQGSKLRMRGTVCEDTVTGCKGVKEV